MILGDLEEEGFLVVRLPDLILEGLVTPGVDLVELLSAAAVVVGAGVGMEVVEEVTPFSSSIFRRG